MCECSVVEVVCCILANELGVDDDLLRGIMDDLLITQALPADYDIFGGPVGVCIKGVECMSVQRRFYGVVLFGLRPVGQRLM